MKKNNLKKLEVFEISLVDRPANQLANVALYKRAEDDSMSEELNVDKAKKPVGAQMPAPEGEDENELEIEVKGKKKDKSMSPNLNPMAKAEEQETISKAALEAINKRIEELAAQNAELKKSAEEDKKALAVEKAAREAVEFAKKAEDNYPAVPGDPKLKGEFLKAVEAMEETVKEFGLGILKSLNDTIADKFTETGKTIAKTASGGVDPSDKMDQLAKDYQKEHGVTLAKAYTEILKTEEGKKLYAESTEG